jgi:6-pyruvoyltetrahydropterin/6-carboxytetrahydropterin synthase
MATIQWITRKGTFDSGHRVMNEKMKCFNMHGHTYLYDLSFSFTAMEDIGYAIDFKEIKRVACQWIDDTLDHGMILNPKDIDVIEAAEKTGSKLWLMSLNGKGEYCNPSVENVVKEIFLAMEILFKKYPMLKTDTITLHETPNCYTTCVANSISNQERLYFTYCKGKSITEYAEKMGILEYDDRKKSHIPQTDTQTSNEVIISETVLRDFGDFKAVRKVSRDISGMLQCEDVIIAKKLPEDISSYEMD